MLWMFTTLGISSFLVERFSALLTKIDTAGEMMIARWVLVRPWEKREKWTGLIKVNDYPDAPLVEATRKWRPIVHCNGYD